MKEKRISISINEREVELLRAHPEINKSQLFRMALFEYAKQHFVQGFYNE